MTSVLGFEGFWPDSSLLAWGAAAVSDDTKVWNAVSGLSISLDEFNLSKEEAYVSLDNPILVRDEFAKCPMLVVGIRLSSDNAYILRPDFGKLGGIVGKLKQRKCLYFVLKDDEALRQYKEYAISNALLYALKQPLREPEQSTAFRFLTQLLVLDPGNPHIHALRVVFSGNNPRMRLIAEKSVGDGASRVLLDTMLNAFVGNNQEYLIRYEDGIAAGGGMDIENASKQLGALSVVHRKLGPIVNQRFDFVEMNDVPGFRFQRLEASSAKLFFSSSVEGESLLQKLGRYVEMQLLQEAIRGHIPAELEQDTDFIQALETIARPTEDTTVYHKPLDSQEPEPVAFSRFAKRTARPEKTIELFGFVQGTAQSVSVVEVRLSPRIREMVSIVSDGSGQTPIGREIFERRNDFLFLPAILTLQRFIDDRGGHKFYLKKIVILEDGASCNVNAVPSAVVRGAFLLDQNVEILFKDGQLLANGTMFYWASGQPNIHTAEAWMQRYASWCEELELAAARTHEAQWLRSPTPRSLSAIARIIVCLAKKGGEALLSDLVADVNANYKATVRTNNTRREVREHSNLVAYDMADEELVRLTERGKLVASIINRASAVS